MTKQNPHREITILIIFKSLCLFNDNANGIAKKQLNIAERKAWYIEKYIKRCV